MPNNEIISPLSIGESLQEVPQPKNGLRITINIKSLRRAKTHCMTVKNSKRNWKKEKEQSLVIEANSVVGGVEKIIGKEIIRRKLKFQSSIRVIKNSRRISKIIRNSREEKRKQDEIKKK